MSTIQLYSGRHFDPTNPTLESFTLMDVIQGMLEAPRFAGHYHIRYTVLQHCLAGARWFRHAGMINEAKYFLWHEGAEGLGFCDLPTPIKYLPEMAEYRRLSKIVDAAVLHKAGLTENPPETVKTLDSVMACAEAKAIMRPIPQWASETNTHQLKVKPYKRLSDVKKEFIREYGLLFPNGIDLHE